MRRPSPRQPWLKCPKCGSVRMVLRQAEDLALFHPEKLGVFCRGCKHRISSQVSADPSGELTFTPEEAAPNA